VTDDAADDERKRYTSRLQLRAQAHVTAELGAAAEAGAELDRQVAMLIQHAQETTGAKRVTLFRPVPRSQRWHTVTLLADGGFYYGLVAPDTLVLPMVAFTQKTPVLLGPGRPRPVPVAAAGEIGFRSYLGLPLLADGAVVAVLEAIDVAKADLLDDYATGLQSAMTALVEALRHSMALQPGGQPVDLPGGVTDETALDLVLRPPADHDHFEVPAAAWPLLAKMDGRTPLAELAVDVGLAVADARALVAGLLGRGLLRVGPEERRRG